METDAPSIMTVVKNDCANKAIGWVTRQIRSMYYPICLHGYAHILALTYIPSFACWSLANRIFHLSRYPERHDRWDQQAEDEISLKIFYLTFKQSESEHRIAKVWICATGRRMWPLSWQLKRLKINLTYIVLKQEFTWRTVRTGIIIHHEMQQWLLVRKLFYEAPLILHGKRKKIVLTNLTVLLLTFPSVHIITTYRPPY